MTVLMSPLRIAKRQRYALDSLREAFSIDWAMRGRRLRRGVQFGSSEQKLLFPIKNFKAFTEIRAAALDPNLGGAMRKSESS
jgi:hypothetical protein